MFTRTWESSHVSKCLIKSSILFPFPGASTWMVKHGMSRVQVWSVSGTEDLDLLELSRHKLLAHLQVLAHSHVLTNLPLSEEPLKAMAVVKKMLLWRQVC